MLDFDNDIEDFKNEFLNKMEKAANSWGRTMAEDKAAQALKAIEEFTDFEAIKKLKRIEMKTLLVNISLIAYTFLNDNSYLEKDE